MTRDELEFSINQYLDGTLADTGRAALEERLATDESVRALFAEYESLQNAFVSAPLPEVRWEKLAAHLSGVVAREAMPAQSYKISAWLRPTRLAAAASVLLAAGIGFSLFQSGGGSGGAGDGTPMEPVRIVRVDLPSGEAVAAATPAAESPIRIAIGPSAEVADEPIVLRYADSVVQRPARAVIVSAAVVGQDSLMTPF